MGNKKILSIAGMLILASCSSNQDTDLALEKRSIEERCLKLEQRWDQAQLKLIEAENRHDSSWLYHTVDTFNPLTSSSNESLKITQRQEERAREMYFATGCADFNKMQINTDPYRESFENEDNKVEETKKESFPEHQSVSAEPHQYDNTIASPISYLMQPYNGY